MKSTTLRGGAALVATTALAFGLGAVPPASAAVIPTPTGADRAPVTVGAAYLAAQPGADGLIVYHSGTGDSVFPGETIDAAVSLDAVGGQAAAVAAMGAGVEASSYGTSSTTQAAKFAAFEYTVGRQSSRLGAAVTLVNDNLAASGRLENPSYAAPLDQVNAVKALHDASASNAAEALDFLITQQCAAGYFPSDYDFGDADTSCDDQTDETPSVDTTAFAILELQDQKSTPAVATVLSKAVTWLLQHQAANGAFVDAYNGTANANSTGLAAWALGVSGNIAAAANAASWLRAHQIANAGSCATYAAGYNGGIATDDLGLKNSNGAFDPVTNSSNVYATAQALPGLLWAAGGTGAGETTLTAADGFVKAGSTQGLAIAGAPGNTLCLTQGTTHTRLVVPASGTLTVPVTLPAGTGTTTIGVVDAGGESDIASYSVLGEKSLRFATAKKLHRGDKATIKVKGLAAHEKARVYLGKKLVDKGRANADGVFKARFPVTHKLGQAKLKVLGQFATRVKTKKIRVVR